jgi:hypothetical protein
MTSAQLSNAELPERLLPAEPGPVSPGDLEILWQLFVAIATAWGDGCRGHESNGHASGGHTSLESALGHGSPDPLALRSQWLEFIEARTLTAPSYGAEYRSAVLTLEELNRVHGSAMWDELLFGESRGASVTSRLGHLRRYVVEEFIKVWLVSGGFKAFGAGNYNGYVSGSRFAVQSPYRLLLKS